MTAGERASLVHDLTRHQDWAALWRVAPDLPACDAVTALRPARRRWHPEATWDRELFNRLAKAKPAELRRARDARNKVIVRTERTRPGSTFLGTRAIRQPETVALEDLLAACLEYRFGRPRSRTR